MVNGELKYGCASKVIKTMTCPPISIGGESIHKFACVVGDCQVCKDKYKPIPFEAESIETMKYTLYTSHHHCSWHGDASITHHNVGKQQKHICTKCEEMSDEDKEKWLKEKKRAANVHTHKIQNQIFASAERCC